MPARHRLSALVRASSVLLGASSILLGAGTATAVTLPDCTGWVYLVPPDPVPGYVILTTGRTTTAHTTRLPSGKYDINHARACVSDYFLLVLGKTERDITELDSAGCPPAVPYTHPAPGGVDDALDLLSCYLSSSSKTKLDVGLRLYYAGYAPSLPNVYFGVASSTALVYSSWDALPQTTDVRCVNKTVQVPRTAGTYFVQVTLLDAAQRAVSSNPPAGKYQGGDTENWSIVVTYDSRAKAYSATLLDSFGLAHGALGCPAPPAPPGGGGHGH